MPQGGICQCRGHPHRHQGPHLPRVDAEELIEGQRLDAERGDHDKRDRHERDQGQGAFEKQVGERERIVLVEDGEGQGDRRVSTPGRPAP